MKVIIRQHPPYASDNMNIIAFNTENDRDIFLDEKCPALFTKNRTAHNRIDSQSLTFRLRTADVNTGLSYSYCETIVQGKREFWFLTSEVKNSTGIIEYTGYKDIYMTYPTIHRDITGGIMTQGHVPRENIFGLTFESGDREIKKVIRLTTDYEDGGGEPPQLFSYIFLSYRRDTILTVEDTVGRMRVKIGGDTITLPYITCIFDMSDPDDVSKHNEVLNDLAARIIGYTSSTYAPFPRFERSVGDAALTGGFLEGEKNQVFNIKYIKEVDADPYNLASRDERNIYDIYLGDDYFQNLNGAEKFDIGIENSISIKIPPVYRLQSDLKILRRFIPTPNETNETFEFITEEYEYLRDSETIWKNTKQMIFGVNAFDEYGANDPIGRAYGLLASPVKGFAGGAGITGSWAGENTSGLVKGSLGTRYNTKKGTFTREDVPDIAFGLTEKGENKFRGGVIGSASNTVSTIASRQSMKGRPEKVIGTGTLLHDIAFNKEGYNLIRVEYEYTTSERENILNGIYRDGVAVGEYVFDTYNNIRRPIFTKFDIANIEEVLPQYDRYNELDILDKTAIYEFYKTPRRYWREVDELFNWQYDNRKSNG